MIHSRRLLSKTQKWWAHHPKERRMKLTAKYNTNQAHTSPSTLVSTISPNAFGLLPARDVAFGSAFILLALALFFKDPTLPFVDNAFLPGAFKICTSTLDFLVGDSDLVTASESGEGGLISPPPGVKDEDRGLLWIGVDLGLGEVGAVDLGLDLDLVGVLVVDLRRGDLGGEGWTGLGGGGSTSILSSSAFGFFVALALCLFAGRGLADVSASSSSPSALAFTLLFVDPTDIEILREWDDTILAWSSSSLSPSSIVRLLRLRDARDVELRRGAGGSWHRSAIHDVSLSSWGVESARNRARLISV